jgi:glutathione S-transferase
MYYLYGAQFSAFTAKARSYLIKQGIPFEERAVGHPRFMGDIIPVTQRMMVPVLETDDGQFVQDTCDILDCLDQRGLEKFPSCPEGGVARAVTHLFELFGGEGLLRAGMFYRWFFDEENMPFVENQFGMFMFPGLPADQRLELALSQTGTMRQRAAALGVTEATGPAIEESFLNFLDAFNDHLEEHPYLVGATPTLGDYGLQVMLYAHLARDPYPSAILKNRAQAVLRFTERMNQPGICAPEYIDYPEEFFADGEVPETLKVMMKLVAEDYLPELEANIALHNQWLGENSVEEGAPIFPDETQRTLGPIQFKVRGTEISGFARSYSLYILQRLQDWVDQLSPEQRKPVLEVFKETGCMPFLELRCSRRVKRANYKEVWGSPMRPFSK